MTQKYAAAFYFFRQYLRISDLIQMSLVMHVVHFGLAVPSRSFIHGIFFFLLIRKMLKIHFHLINNKADHM